MSRQRIIRSKSRLFIILNQYLDTATGKSRSVYGSSSDFRPPRFVPLFRLFPPLHLATPWAENAGLATRSKHSLKVS